MKNQCTFIRFLVAYTVVAVLNQPAIAFDTVDLGPAALTLTSSMPVDSGHGYVTSLRSACLSSRQRDAIMRDLAASRRDLTERGLLPAPDRSRQVSLVWPVRAAAGVTDPGIHGISGFLDHDPNYPNQLLDWNCGDRSYDLDVGYNHQGTDIFLWPFYWHRMDDDEAEIVAGADGVIIQKYDGNYDRNCGFGGDMWNAVYIEHADGSIAWYGHMKNGSTTSKSVGESVTAGEYLGIVGSSGSSTGPHLHLEMYKGNGQLLDPWHGPCNDLDKGSWWSEQRPYYDSAINALRTHSAPPEWLECPEPTITNEQDEFAPGDPVYFGAYYRDQLQDQLSEFKVRRPDGSVWQEWTTAMEVPFYAATWWYWSWDLPIDAESGFWSFNIQYEGQGVTHYFHVGTGVAVEDVPTAGPVLHASRPNPFNPMTTIAFTLERGGRTVVDLFDQRGRLVSQLLDGVCPAGHHQVTWNGRHVDGRAAASGVYRVRLQADGETRWERMSLVR